MYEWSEEQLMVRDAVRQFIDKDERDICIDLAGLSRICYYHSGFGIINNISQEVGRVG